MEEPRDALKTPPVSNDLTGSSVGRFVIRGRVGAGGMGQVYCADDPTLKRTVAIKRMAPELQLEERDRQRFLKEAQRASALSHPNIAGIFDVLQEKGEILLVMEYIEGATLRQRLAKPISVEQFLDIAIQCAEGLGAAHEKGILHGDVKPENIMLTASQRVKILDFGVARRFTIADANQATRSLATMTAPFAGTPAYMAPEVLLQNPYDGRADIFSLGLVYYEMLGGRQPFQTYSFAGTLDRILHQEPPSLSAVNRHVPPGLASIVARMLAKDPAERYATAQDLVADLRAVQRGSQPSLPAMRLPKPRTTRAVAWIAALAGVVLLAGFFAISRMTHSPSRPQAGPNASGLPQIKNLAVLPFVPVEGDPKISAFGNGLVETLTAKLTQLGDNHPLQVIPASELRDKHVTTLEQARQEFGATLGLQVTLQQSGDLVRATYTLTDAKRGRALGANSITAPVTDSFAIQDQVAAGAASTLGIELRPEERRALLSHGTSLPEAYNYYLQSRGYLEDTNKPENIESAIILLRHALKLDPNYGMAGAQLGMAYWSKYVLKKDKQWINAAKEACSKAVESGVAGAEGHVCLGVLNNGTGQYEPAVAEFQRAIELEPANDQAYSGLALAFQRLNKLDDAEKTYQRVISLRPQYPPGYKLLGAFYLRQAQPVKAAEMFSRMVELAPDSYPAYSNLAAALLYQARYEDAIKPLQQSIAIRPTYFAYTNLGTAYLRLRRFSDAARAYQQATQLDGVQYVAWGSLGDAYHYSGDRAQAMNAYQKAVQLAQQQLQVNPKDAEVLGDLADYYAMQGERTQALASLDHSLQFGHGDKDLLFNAAVVYDELGETGVALEWLKKSLDAGISVRTVRESPAFDNLKGDPRLEEILRGREN
jgi:serine/threonine protein kinase/tetratricopeptide (TPR) repeat protein